MPLNKIFDISTYRYIGISIVFCLLSLSEAVFIPLSAQTTEMETRYNALAARFDGRDKLLQRDLKDYLQAYPYTTFTDEVHFMQGVLQVEKGHYKQGLKILEPINIKALSRAHQTDYSFYRGYAYLMMQEYQRASVYFSQLSKGTSRHTTRGTYYYAYCMYKLEKYDKALPAFKQLENTPQYDKTVPYYLVQLYYAQGNYEEAEARANTLLREHPESLNNGELHRILGEMAYLRQDYAKATEHLNSYLASASEQKAEPLRSDMYMLGNAAFRSGDYEAAVKAYKQVKQDIMYYLQYIQ